MTPGLLISRLTKNKLFCKKLNNPNQINITKFKTYKNIFNKVCRYAKFKFTQDTFTENKNDAKKMWALINSCIGRKVKKGIDVPNFFEENGLVFDNFTDIAEGFNDFFVNIGEKLQQKLPKAHHKITDFLGSPSPYNFSFELIDDYDILLECSKIKPKTS